MSYWVRLHANKPALPGRVVNEIVEKWWATSVASSIARDVLVAAIELFAEHGYQLTTTRDIANRVGLSTEAMYACFSSKEALLYEVVLVGHQRSWEEMTATVRKTATPARQLAAAIGLFAEYHARFHTVAKVVHAGLPGITPDHLQDVIAVRRRTRALVVDIVERGVDAGVFTVTDVPTVARALLSLCIDVSRWYQPGLGITPDQLGVLYGDLALRMVAVPPAASRAATEIGTYPQRL